MGSDEHEHDSHYHGEPSRVLDDTPLADTVILYQGGFRGVNGSPTAQLDSDHVKRWAKSIDSVKEIDHILVPEGNESFQNKAIQTYPSSKVEPFHPEFSEFPDHSFPSGILFLPLHLTMNPGTWEDLRANDVTVNWISLDPAEESERFPGVVLLSDWITDVRYDLPPARSTGVFPGIFSISPDDLKNFEELFQKNDRLDELFTSFLDGEGNKLRPCFLHDREWSYQ